jgi:hypothetical protein
VIKTLLVKPEEVFKEIGMSSSFKISTLSFELLEKFILKDKRILILANAGDSINSFIIQYKDYLQDVKTPVLIIGSMENIKDLRFNIIVTAPQLLFNTKDIPRFNILIIDYSHEVTFSPEFFIKLIAQINPEYKIYLKASPIELTERGRQEYIRQQTIAKHNKKLLLTIAAQGEKK